MDLKKLKEQAQREGWSKQKLKSIRGQMLHKQEGLKVLELFGGIGACSNALRNIGIKHSIIDYVEINEKAVCSYNAIYGRDFKPQDITKWDKNINVDLIMHGSPYQDFSITGLGKGGDEGSGTRSSLMFETIRIVEKLRPKYVIWENVKNVTSQTNVHNLLKYIEYLNKLGYTSTYKVLNAIDYGIPQKRERLICVSILGNRQYVFPKPCDLNFQLEDLVHFRECDDITGNFYKRYLEKINPKATREEFKQYVEDLPIAKGIGTKKMGPYDFSELDTITTATGITGTLTCRNVQNYNKKYWYKQRLYKPSPLMCWRLMGFKDEDFCKASKVCNDKDLYNQAGNSIVVNVLEAVLKELLYR